MTEVTIEKFLELSDHNPVVDVRSPAEFERGHIPGAVNIPLFSNQERSIVGTAYKKEGRDQAIHLGLEIIGPKLSFLVQEAKKLCIRDHLLVHCWRGGMRSESYSWLLNLAGINTMTLEKGYKNFRNHLLDSLAQPLKLIILTGSTGSGKTDILKELSSRGEQIIDLEALACHRGSVFGSLGQTDQPTTEQFQNNIFEQFYPMDTNRRIWIEDESIGIGNVFIPEPLWHQMKKSPAIRMELDKKVRVDRLVSDYGRYPKEELEVRIEKITKRLGDQAIPCIESLYEGQLKSTAEKLLGYYDRAYNNSITKKSRRILREFYFDVFDEKSISDSLLQCADQFEKALLSDG